MYIETERNTLGKRSTKEKMNKISLVGWLQKRGLCPLFCVLEFFLTWEILIFVLVPYSKGGEKRFIFYAKNIFLGFFPT